MSIAWFLERIALWRDQPAIVWGDRSYTYGELLDRIEHWTIELKRHHIGPGQVVAFEGDYSPNACSLMLALIDLQTVVVPLTRASRAHREDYLAISEVQATIDFDDNDGWTFTRREATVKNQLTRDLIERGTPGLVVFSSGSTGKSKAILHDFEALLEKFRVLRHRRCTITFLLLDHLGGINTMLYTLSNGGTVVSVQSRDPAVVCKSISDNKVQCLPTSPTFLNLLLISEAYKNFDLSSLQLITYGTEAMPESTLSRLREVFPGVDLLQTYGLSELGVMRSKSKSSDSLWLKIGGEGFETKIVDGILWIRAKSAMIGYLNAPSPFDSDGWMNTQDMVEVDGDYIRILGRATEIINVGGQKVYPAEVESVLLQMDNIRDVTVFGQENAITGQIVAARITLLQQESPVEFKRRMRDYCKGRLAAFKIPVRVDTSGGDQHSARYKKMRGAP